MIGHGDRLWVSSWGDNRIETYQLHPQGASWTSQTEVVVQGDANFRPVGMAVAGDGSIYVTDWVDRSYPVHGKGRLWRLSRTKEVSADQRQPSRQDSRPKSICSDSNRTMGVFGDSHVAALDSDDPFVRQAAIAGLISDRTTQSLHRDDAESPSGNASGCLTAWRWLELSSPQNVSAATRKEWIDWGLADGSQEVVMAAMRWATERGLVEHLETIRSLLGRPSLSPRMFAAVIAAIAYLETGSAARGRRDPRARATAVPVRGGPEPFPGDAQPWPYACCPRRQSSPLARNSQNGSSTTHDRNLGIEIVRLLALRSDRYTLDILARLAKNEGIPRSNSRRCLVQPRPNCGRVCRHSQFAGSSWSARGIARGSEKDDSTIMDSGILSVRRHGRSRCLGRAGRRGW